MTTYEQIAKCFTDDDSDAARLALIDAVVEAEDAEIDALAAERDEWREDERATLEDCQR